MVSATTFETVLLAATLAAIGCIALEWRRADRRHLALRLAATLLAIAALAALILRPSWNHASPASSGVEAALWTPTASPSSVPSGVDTRYRFALPSAAAPGPAASPVPDAAFLRRRFPEIGTLHVFGDGLDPSELDALRGLRVTFAASPTLPVGSAPAVRFLCCPRELPLGDAFAVRGRVGGLPPNATLPLTLEAPDGTLTRADTAPADAAGEAAFALHSASPSAAGRFLWHLRLPASADLPLGAAVIPPTLPRVLILESAPRFDTAALRRWFGAAGGTLTARTQVGQDRYQYAAAAATAASSPPPFTALNAPLLAGVDLVVADLPALLALPPAEHDALLAAVADTGVGLLVLPADPPPAAGSVFFPWRLSPLTPDTQGGDRPARLQWPGQTVPTDLPVPTAPFEVLPTPTQRPLLDDRQGHTLAAAVPHGRGEIALTLVRDTTRWQRTDAPAAFAAYWSFLFSRLARPADPAGRWTLQDGDVGPVFVDHPLTLLWSGPADHPPGAAVVNASAAPGDTTLDLAPIPAEPGRWQGTFWPRRAGWHRVSLRSGGPVLDFHVSAAEAWPALAAERRRDATALFAEISAAPSVRLPPSSMRRELSPLWSAAVFFLAAAYLWIERRFTS